MALIITTTDASALLNRIYKAIDDEDIVTWEYDDQKDLTHTTKSEQWLGKAWFEASIRDDNQTLGFGIIGNKSEGITKINYAVYHGRFLEMLLAHFDQYFSEAQISALLDIEFDYASTE